LAKGGTVGKFSGGCPDEKRREREKKKKNVEGHWSKRSPKRKSLEKGGREKKNGEGGKKEPPV